MNQTVEDFFSELEVKLRRKLGKKRASQVSAEMRGHLEESVASLVASGQSEDDAIAASIKNLGEINASQFIPTDGAPQWFNRRTRSKIVFWYVFTFTTLLFWTLAFDRSFAFLPQVLTAVTFVVFAAVGSFGGRFVLLPLAKAMAVAPIVTGLAATFLCVNIGPPNSLPRIRWVAESDRRSANLAWVAAGRPTDAELARVSRLRYFYSIKSKTDDGLSEYGRGPKGQYRYPDTSGINWSSETPDFAFAGHQWRTRGSNLYSNLSYAVRSHKLEQTDLSPALDKHWSSPVPGFLFAAIIGLWFVISGIFCALFGDIVRSSAIALARTWRTFKSRQVRG